MANVVLNDVRFSYQTYVRSKLSCVQLRKDSRTVSVRRLSVSDTVIGNFDDKCCSFGKRSDCISNSGSSYVQRQRLAAIYIFIIAAYCW